MKKRRIKKRVKLLIFVIIIVLSTFGIGKILSSHSIDITLSNEKRQKEEEERKRQLFLTCMKSPLDDSLLSSLDEEKEQLNSFLSQYKTSVYYVNLSDNFNYFYKEDKVYSAASLIKLLDALYIYEGAAKGLIDLEELVEYKSIHKIGDSDIMNDKPLGTMVSLRDLVSYALTYSDNVAHLMLYDYIGYEELGRYAKELNLTTVASTTQKWGSITAIDANILILRINDFINNNKELGNELKSYMLNDKDNVLGSSTDYPVAHKYGLMKPVYHDVGIIYHEYPYSLVVLSEHSSNYEVVVSSIHQEIIKLHNDYLAVKESYCSSE